MKKIKFRNKKSNYLILSFMWVGFIFMTICFSVFNEELNISGEAYIRVKADIRVTNVSLQENLNGGGIEYNPKYSKDSVTLYSYLPNENSKITYAIDITNKTSNDYGILNITGMNDNLNYTITNYTLKNKLCTTGNCNNGNIDKIYVTVSYKEGKFNPNNTTFSDTLLFNLKNIYSVEYINIDKNKYPSAIMEGDDFSIKFDEIVNGLIIKRNNEELTKNIDYTFENNVLTIKNNTK